MATYNAYGGPTYKLPAPKPPPAPKAAFYPSNTVSAAAARGGLPAVAAAFPGSVVQSGGGGDGSDGGDGGYGGYQQQQRAPFDFSTDPGYLAALAAEQAGSAGLDASLRAARERALVDFGDPSLAGAFGIGDLSPLTAAMAQQATTSGVSTLAQLQRARDQNQQTIQNQLAAHGIIRSGDLGYKTGQNQQDYGSSLYSAQQGVLDTLAGKASDVASQKAGLHTNTVSALTNAYNTYVNDPSYYGMVDQQGLSPLSAALAQPTVDSTYPAATAARQATPVATALAKPTTPAVKPPAPPQTPYVPYGPTKAPVSRLATPARR
jgi:hypothetical protein